MDDDNDNDNDDDDDDDVCSMMRHVLMTRLHLQWMQVCQQTLSS